MINSIKNVFYDRATAQNTEDSAAVDADTEPNDLSFGQTDKIFTPAPYVAIAISCAIQHLTGIKYAGTRVAISKDAEAPFLEVANIGLVLDLFNVLPELETQLST